MFLLCLVAFHLQIYSYLETHHIVFLGIMSINPVLEEESYMETSLT